MAGFPLPHGRRRKKSDLWVMGLENGEGKGFRLFSPFFLRRFFFSFFAFSDYSSKVASKFFFFCFCLS
jgi:hypothetical protein